MATHIRSKGSFRVLWFVMLSSLFSPINLFARHEVSFVARRDFGVGNSPRCVTIGDFNQDAIPDLAVVNYYSNNVSILLGQGDGTFGPPQNFPVGAKPTCIVTGDFNGDRHLDLAVSNYE